MILKLRLLFYILFLFPAIAFTDAPSTKGVKRDFFLKNNEEIIFLKDKNNSILELKPLRSMKAQAQGLSGVKREQLKTNQGAIFIYDGMSSRSFWMPDTYFDLAIIFLDENLVVKFVEKKAIAHPGRKEPPIIFRTKAVEAKYVVEIPADNPIVFSLNVGDRFEFLK
tara:strand:- start:4692 stop:5192 length:501 start_codon:yes stop_codon:yes gene_type:complete